jgi:hypothetical protein
VSWTEPGATCWVYPSAVRFVTRTTPTIYAIDYWPGYGNDWQWVHFRSRVVDNTSGVTVWTGPWSPWAAAYDNSPATYSGQESITVMKASMSSTYRVMIDIEWWSQTERLFGRTIPIGRYWAYLYFPNLGAFQQNGIQLSC